VRLDCVRCGLKKGQPMSTEWGVTSATTAQGCPMNMVERARRFVESLLEPREGGARTAGSGTPSVTGATNARCATWGERSSYSEADRRWGRYQRYAWRVQRKALDVYFVVGGSLRTVCEVLHGEVAPGAGLAGCGWTKSHRARREHRPTAASRPCPFCVCARRRQSTIACACGPGQPALFFCSPR